MFNFIKILFIIYLNIFIIFVKSEFKQITLWKKSNICKNILSGVIPLDSGNKMKVENSLNMNITKIDVNSFPKVLSTFPNYNETLYKGVFENDILLDKLIYDKALITNQYYSFYKSLEKARSFGYNTILRLKSNRTFDLSDEVILDKNILLQVAYKEELTNLLIINLIEI